MIAGVAREHDDELVIACGKRTLVGNGRNEGAVEQRVAVKAHDGCKKGHGRRGAHRNKFLADALLVEPDRLAAFDIRSADLQDAGIISVGSIIEGQQLLGQVLKDEVEAEDAALFNPVMQTEIALVGDIVLDYLARAQGLV